MFTTIDRTRCLSRLKRHARLFVFFIVCLFSVTTHAQMPEIVWDTIHSTNTFDFAAKVIRIENGYAVIGSEDQHELNSAFSGDYFVATYDEFVATYDESGNQLSQWSYGGFNNDEGIDLMQTADGGYILIGHSFSTGGDISNHHHSPNGARSDAWVVKINSAGQIEWERSLGGNGNDGGFDIKILSDGSYLAAGKAKSTNGDVSTSLGGDDAWVVHLDINGEILWEKTYGGSSDDLIWDMQVTDDGGFIFIGHTFSTDGDLLNTPVQSYNDAWLVKCDADGEIEWQRLLGNPDYFDYGRAIKKTDDGYIAAYMRYSGEGTGTSTMNVVKVDFDGEIVWTYQNEATAGYTAPSDITFTETGDILMCGSFSNSVTSYMIVMQLSGETGELAWTYNVPEMTTPFVTSRSVAYGISPLRWHFTIEQ